MFDLRLSIKSLSKRECKWKISFVYNKSIRRSNKLSINYHQFSTIQRLYSSFDNMKRKLENKFEINDDIFIKDEDIYDELIGKGMTEEVFKLIKEQSKIPSISSHENINKLSIVNNLMKNLSSEGNVTKIFELYNKLNQLEIKLNHETYFYLLMCCLLDKTQNHVDKVLNLLEDIKTKGVEVNIQIMNISLMICAMKRDLLAMLSVFKLMKELNIKPDSISYIHFVNALEDKSISKILLFWNSFKSIQQPELISFLFISKAIIKTGNLNYLRNIYNEMCNYNIIPDVDILHIFFEASIYGVDMIDFGELLFDKVLNEWRDKIHFNKTIIYDLLKISSLISASKLHSVIELMRQEKIDFDKTIFEIIILAYGKFNMKSKVIKYLNMAIARDMLTTDCYNGLLVIYRNDKDSENAWKTYQNLLENQYEMTKTFILLLHSVLQVCKRDDLIKIFKKDIEKYKWNEIPPN